MNPMTLDPAMTGLSSARVLKRADCERLVSAEAVLASARQQAAQQQTQVDALHLEAQRAGYMAGVEMGKQAWAQEITQRHFSRQSQLAGMNDVLVGVVMSSLRHLVGELPAEMRFDALARQVLGAASRARNLRLVVSAANADAARAVLEHWQRSHPEVLAIDVIVEPTLSDGDCVVETEDGAIDGRLSERLAAIEAALAQRLAQVATGGQR